MMDTKVLTLIVDDDQLIAAQEGGEFAEIAILPGAGSPLEQQHARGSPLHQRLLRDSFGRKIEVEFA